MSFWRGDSRLNLLCNYVISRVHRSRLCRCHEKVLQAGPPMRPRMNPTAETGSGSDPDGEPGPVVPTLSGCCLWQPAVDSHATRQSKKLHHITKLFICKKKLVFVVRPSKRISLDLFVGERQHDPVIGRRPRPDPIQVVLKFSGIQVAR